MGKIRDYCEEIGVAVVGKLTYYGKPDFLHRLYMDEAMTEFWIDGVTGSVYVLPTRPVT